MTGPFELREEVIPAGPFRLPRRAGMDGMLRRRSGVLERLLHHGEEPVLVRVAQPARDRVLLGARARSREAAEHGISRMRFALGVDFDQRPFLRRFAHDELIGRSVRRRPWLRVGRRPEPFEALVLAICEQLIEYERAAAIERRIVAALGRRWVGWDGGHSNLADMPAAELLAGTAPALLQSFDLAGCRAITLTRAAREVARGRVDLSAERHEDGWRRLRAIPGIGPWTVEMLALNGQGRHDQLPAGDLGLLKFVGRALSGGDPRAIAEEQQVREFFAPYGEWAGLAAVHAVGL
ncbi:MAG: DNA-3-methyladenine glycosylase 2 family protein [Solirubrobacterales bacterium]|nr:DNA-3-methyladenine glycosylase 2 family protein [Solirubrobacterales bacterium]